MISTLTSVLEPQLQDFLPNKMVEVELVVRYIMVEKGELVARFNMVGKGELVDKMQMVGMGELVVRCNMVQ